MPCRDADGCSSSGASRGSARVVSPRNWRAGPREDGAEVHWGRCWEAGGAPPYWPWAQAIRSCVRERSPQQLRQELGSGAAAIADLVPDVRTHLPDLSPPPTLSDPQQARFRLFDAIAGFLQRASASSPLVLVLDDLNWADKESLLLLEYLARELADAHLLLVGTYRDVDLSRRHPLSQTLGEARRRATVRARRAERSLAPGRRALRQGRRAASSPTRLWSRAIHTQHGGKPLLRQRARSALAERRER